MERHPYFDLWLHSTQELSELLSFGIVERTTLHEWPLSCVQLLKLADGRPLIYKSQLQATTVEPEFYSAVHKDPAVYTRIYRPRLPRTDLLGILRNSVAMTIEYIDAPRLEDFQMNEAEILDHGNRLLSEMSRFQPELPVYIDISTQAKWLSFVEETISMLNSVIASGQFRLTKSAAVQGLSKWARSEAIIAILQSPPALNHRDLGGYNVFVTPNGYKIIDWQRPVRGPAELDRVGYLSAMGIDPFRYIDPGIIGLSRFLSMQWFVECKAHWFPPGESYDRQVADFADQILQLC